MQNRSELPLWLLLCCALVCALGATRSAGAQACPTPADQIVTDRPDVTNSSLVVPFGSLQAENGVDWMNRHGSNVLDATNTRLRAGIAHCMEFLIDIPSYSGSVNGSQPSGFSNLVVSFKRQLPAPFGFDLSATGGLGLPTGTTKISGRGYQPYIQFPWSHELTHGWAVEGMFTLVWFPSDSQKNLTFEPTFALEKELGDSVGLFAEYVGDYDHQRPSQLADGGGTWRFTRTQQLDFHVGFGLNSSSVDNYFGIGYSIRLDHLWDGNSGTSP